MLWDMKIEIMTLLNILIIVLQGDYPTELVDRDSGNLSTQLSLLSDN